MKTFLGFALGAVTATVAVVTTELVLVHKFSGHNLAKELASTVRHVVSEEFRKSA